MNRVRGIGFIADFPDFWPVLQQPTRTALQETVDNEQGATLTDYTILSGLIVSHFRPSLLRLVGELTDDQLEQAVATVPLIGLWPRAVDRYRRSRSYRGSEAYFRDLIAPFTGRLDTQQLDQLLDAVTDNGQNWDAGGTPGSLHAFLREAGTTRPSAAARDRLYQELRRSRRLERFDDLLTLLQADGWVFPPTPQEEEE